VSKKLVLTLKHCAIVTPVAFVLTLALSWPLASTGLQKSSEDIDAVRETSRYTMWDSVSSKKVVGRQMAVPMGLRGWNLCEPVEWKMNLNGAPRKEIALIKTSLKRVEKVTGLEYEYTGTSKHIPYANGRQAQPDDADLFLSFSTEKTVEGLSGGTMGIGGYTAIYNGSSASKSKIVAGGAVFDKDSKTLPKKTRLNLYMHELGHTLGLNHTMGMQDIMFPTVQKKVQFSAADKGHLKKLGYSKSECVPDNPKMVDPDSLEVQVENDGHVWGTWEHDPTGAINRLGGGIAPTVAYIVRVTLAEDQENFIQIPVPGGSGKRQVRADLGPAEDFQLDDGWFYGEFEVYPSATGKNPPDSVWDQYDGDEISFELPPR